MKHFRAESRNQKNIEIFAVMKYKGFLLKEKADKVVFDAQQCNARFPFETKKIKLFR